MSDIIKEQPMGLEVSGETHDSDGLNTQELSATTMGGNDIAAELKQRLDQLKIGKELRGQADQEVEDAVAEYKSEVRGIFQEFLENASNREEFLQIFDVATDYSRDGDFGPVVDTIFSKNFGASLESIKREAFLEFSSKSGRYQPGETPDLRMFMPKTVMINPDLEPSCISAGVDTKKTLAKVRGVLAGESADDQKQRDEGLVFGMVGELMFCKDRDLARELVKKIFGDLPENDKKYYQKAIGDILKRIPEPNIDGLSKEFTGSFDLQRSEGVGAYVLYSKEKTHDVAQALLDGRLSLSDFEKEKGEQEKPWIPNINIGRDGVRRGQQVNYEYLSALIKQNTEDQQGFVAGLIRENIKTQ